MTLPTMSKHAIERALDMGVTGEEIRQCLEYPETNYKSKKYENTTNFMAGRLIVAVRDNTVVTVGWATLDLWKEDLERGEYGGRHFPAQASEQGAQ